MMNKILSVQTNEIDCIKCKSWNKWYQTLRENCTSKTLNLTLHLHVEKEKPFMITAALCMFA